MKYLTLTSTDPHFNMAFDQYVLEHAICPEPVFYLWRNRPSVIIGENQSVYAEVNLTYLSEQGIALARRVTGGGAVYHDLQNLNYTICGRSLDLDRDYPAYAFMLVDALCRLGVPARLSGRNDILVEGRKCSGYAKRIWKDRLMVHGTLMFDVDLEALTKALSTPGSKLSSKGIASVRSRVANLKDYLPAGMDMGRFQTALHEILSGGDAEIALPEGSVAEIEQLAEEKFRSREWIFSHSPQTSLSREQIFSCGTVRASFLIRHGRMENLRFSGDFMGNLPVAELEKHLDGCPYTPESLRERLPAEIAQYFDGMEAEAFLRFILP